MTSELKERARKDFEASKLPLIEWDSFWAGYLAAVKRFATK